MNNIVIGLLLFVLVLYIFKPYIMPYFWRIIYKSPVALENIKIEFPKGFILTKGEDNVSLHLWNKPHVFLYVRKVNPQRLEKKKLLNFFKNKGFHILRIQDSTLREYKGFSISYINNSWEYNKLLCIPSKGLYIEYTGTKKDYKPFKKIIQNIKFRHERVTH